MSSEKPQLSFWQIWNMCFGFFGIQFGFGLQQANLSPVFRYHGAEESSLPILWLAGPITGLIFQPLVGALSDKTWNRFGRRKPYLLFGALIGSIAIMFMPYVPVLWMVVGLFWILDAAMNTAMEPYRALVGDKLSSTQRTVGFSVQAFMIALGQILAGLMPLLMIFLGVATVAEDGKIPDIVKYSFLVGVGTILLTTLWTYFTTPEDAPVHELNSGIKPSPVQHTKRALGDIIDAVKTMPDAVKKLWWVKLACWYGIPLMWQYLALSIARHNFNAPTPDSPGFTEGAANVGLALTVMNVTTLFLSFFIPYLTRRFCIANVYAVMLFIGGMGFVSLLFASNLSLVFMFMALVGVGWTAIVTLPFIIVANVVPKAQVGVYMGLVNAFICIPQILSNLTVGLFYDSLLFGDPRNALVLCGITLMVGSLLALRLKHSPTTNNNSRFTRTLQGK